jgi:hypothetical protein
VTDTDYEAAYRDLRLRVTDLLRDRDDASMEQAVPATPEGSFVIGAGEPRCTVRTSRAELLRAITGRRSVAQLRALDHDGEPLDAVLFRHLIFRPASRDLVE